MLPDLSGLRVCFIAGTLGRGGAERQLFYMLRALTASNVFSLVLSLTQGELYEERIRSLGVPVVWVGNASSRVRRLYSITRELQRWRPHVVQSAHSFTNLYAFAGARLVSARDIGAIRSNFEDEFVRLGHWGRLSARLPSLLLANSKQAIVAAREAGVRSSRLCLLENAVDTERFYPPALHTKGEVVRILGVGSIKPVKRHDVFLKALAEVKRAAPALAWQALLVGEGPLRGDMEVLAADLKLGNRVIFAGAQDDMPPVYRQADILVHTSDFEGMPNVILEAMACGLPVVATRVGATPDLVVTGKTGYLASPGDVSSLADKILCLAQQPDLRRQMGRAARKRVVDTYSLSALQENLLSLYTNLLQEYRTGVVEGLSS